MRIVLEEAEVLNGPMFRKMISKEKNANEEDH